MQQDMHIAIYSGTWFKNMTNVPPVNNDVPAGQGCPVFMTSGPTVLDYELQIRVKRLH